MLILKFYKKIPKIFSRRERLHCLFSFLPNKKKNERIFQNKTIKQGFTLIETLVGVFILAVGILTIYSLFNMSLRVIWESKAKITATQLANQKLEMARNLPYNEVGTIGGIPAGGIPQTEQVTRNNINFTVETNVIYIDDPFDGIQGGNPDDSLPTDYKRVRVRVSWTSKYGAKDLIFLTDVAPNGVETAEGGGTLKILVFNADGEFVPQANVHITNSSVSPEIDLTTQTNEKGIILLPGAPAAVESYQITVAKDGYSIDQTYPATAELPSPNKPPLSVYEGQVTSASFSIDLLSDLTLYVQDINSVLLADIGVQITGKKTIGLDTQGLPVYKFDQLYTSNVSGQIILNDIEWDSYIFKLDDSEPYDISEYSPPQPLDILPDSSREMILTLSPQAEYSVLIIVKNVDDQPIEGANVHLSSTNPFLDETLTTSAAGQTYFTPWAEATTTLEVTKDGYEAYNDNLDVSGYYTETVILTAP